MYSIWIHNTGRRVCWWILIWVGYFCRRIKKFLWPNNILFSSPGSFSGDPTETHPGVVNMVGGGQEAQQHHQQQQQLLLLRDQPATLSTRPAVLSASAGAYRVAPTEAPASSYILLQTGGSTVMMAQQGRQQQQHHHHQFLTVDPCHLDINNRGKNIGLKGRSVNSILFWRRRVGSCTEPPHFSSAPSLATGYCWDVFSKIPVASKNGTYSTFKQFVFILNNTVYGSSSNQQTFTIKSWKI